MGVQVRTDYGTFRYIDGEYTSYDGSELRVENEDNDTIAAFVDFLHWEFFDSEQERESMEVLKGQNFTLHREVSELKDRYADLLAKQVGWKPGRKVMRQFK